MSARAVPLHEHEFASRFKVGKFTIVLTLTAGRLGCEWNPRVPRCGELGESEIAEYRRRRDESLHQLRHDTGYAGIVVDPFDILVVLPAKSDR